MLLDARRSDTETMEIISDITGKDQGLQHPLNQTSHCFLF